MFGWFKKPEPRPTRQEILDTALALSELAGARARLGMVQVLEGDKAASAESAGEARDLLAASRLLTDMVKAGMEVS